MAQADDENGMSSFSMKIPNNWKEALWLLSQERTTRDNRVNMSTVAREYIKEGLANEEDVPEEVRDLLDDDLLANGGDEDA